MRGSMSLATHTLSPSAAALTPSCLVRCPPAAHMAAFGRSLVLGMSPQHIKAPLHTQPAAMSASFHPPSSYERFPNAMGSCSCRWLQPTRPRLLLLGFGLALISLVCQIIRPPFRCRPHTLARKLPSTSVPHAPCEDWGPEGPEGGSCLQQALWGKCSQPFMAGVCNKSCGRCVSTARSAALRRVMLVSARQTSPCTSPDGDAWVMRAQQNKAEFARVHGLSLSWTSAQVDAQARGVGGCGWIA